jgi:hypothetical protein
MVGIACASMTLLLMVTLLNRNCDIAATINQHVSYQISPSLILALHGQSF